MHVCMQSPMGGWLATPSTPPGSAPVLIKFDTVFNTLDQQISMSAPPALVVVSKFV